jgi:hypothetical protein
MAIKISGTTVVNDSRQLQNIASLDSTTAATIGAAAAGGATLSSSGTFNAGSVEITIPNADFVKVVFYDVSTSNSYNNNRCYIRIKPVNGGYDTAGWPNSNYDTAGFSRGYSSSSNLTDNQPIWVCTGYCDYFDGFIEIRNPKSTTEKKFGHFEFFHRFESQNQNYQLSYNNESHGTHRWRQTAAIDKIKLEYYVGGSNYNGRYEVWTIT